MAGDAGMIGTAVDLASAMRVAIDDAESVLAAGMHTERLAGLKNTSGTFTGIFDSGKSGITFPLTMPIVHVLFNDRKYTPAQFMDYYRNEVLRKGNRPHVLTRSPRWRAGTRRSKKFARATR